MSTKPLSILFIGNYQSGYVGEVADETHLTRELEACGHTVYRVNRDEWREYVIEQKPQGKYKIPENVHIDVAVICKWHHFYDGTFITAIKEKYGCPVFYWTWDFMDYDGGWHEQMARAADMFLTNEGGKVSTLMARGIPAYYFPFDVTDGMIDPMFVKEKQYDVTFFGSHLKQGDRVDWLQYLNDHIPVHIFSWNHEEWKKLGFDAEPAVYGKDFALKVAASKVILGFNVNDHCLGYWSNRVGKVLALGGCLLYRYVPGMELALGDAASYFSTKEEMLEQTRYLLNHRIAREQQQERARERGKRFTSKERIKELVVLMERYLSGAFIRKESV